MTSRNLLLAGVAAGALVLTGPAVAQGLSVPQSLYGTVSGGTATYFDQGGFEFDYLGFVIAGQAGFRLTPEMRVEGEIAYQSTSAEDDIGLVDVDVDLTAIRTSASVYYDFNSVSIGGMTPYAGGGLGFTFIEVDFDNGFGSDDDTELSAHLEGGSTLKLSNNLDLVPAARWELTDDASNFQLRVGARFWF